MSMPVFPILDTPTETVTFWLKHLGSRIILTGETLCFLVTRAFCEFNGVSMVNVFSSVIHRLRTLRAVSWCFYRTQGSVATHLRCDGIFSDNVITNFLLILTVKVI